MSATLLTTDETKPDFAADFVTALAGRVVLLDPGGRVTCANEAPTLVTLDATAPQTLLRPGISYPALCRHAEAAGLGGAGAVAAGVTAVLRGTRPDARLRLDGVRQLEVQVSPLQTGSGAVVVHQDVTATTVTAAQLSELRRLAYRDSLTGLGNRNHFFQEVESCLNAARQAGHAVALVYLDLDGFKEVNDTHGHVLGDAVLRVVGGRLQRLVRPYDLVARLGGDEFAFFLMDVTEAEVAGLVRRVRHALAQPVALAGTELRLGVSVGSALFSEVGEDITALLTSADRAMYDAKRRPGKVEPR